MHCNTNTRYLSILQPKADTVAKTSRLASRTHPYKYARASNAKHKAMIMCSRELFTAPSILAFATYSASVNRLVAKIERSSVAKCRPGQNEIGQASILLESLTTAQLSAPFTSVRRPNTLGGNDLSFHTGAHTGRSPISERVTAHGIPALKRGSIPRDRVDRFFRI